MKNNYFHLFDEGQVLQHQFMGLISNSILTRSVKSYKLLFKVIMATTNKDVINNIIKYMKIAMAQDEYLRNPIEKSQVKNIYKMVKNTDNVELLQSIIDMLYYFQPTIFTTTNSFISNKEKDRLTILGIVF